MKKKIYIVSPREPSGATWLINCFLELGIKCYRVHESQMWIKTEFGYMLTDEEKILKQWLPILSRRNLFFFREDMEVQWTHEWPQEKFLSHKIIFFTRDPRDSLYSRYKRESPNLTYIEFINFLEDKSLLNKIDNWLLFHLLWLNHNNLKVFHFEKYKKDALSLLNEILVWIEEDFSENIKIHAIENSTSEQATLAEKKYLSNINCESVINQGGTVGRWKLNRDETEIVNTKLEYNGGFLLKELGYIISDISINKDIFNDKVSFNLNFNPFFDSLPVDIKKKIVLNFKYEYLEIIRKFICELDDVLLKKSKLKPYELNNIKYAYKETMKRFNKDINESIILLENVKC